jgi:hypothetical protein
MNGGGPMYSIDVYDICHKMPARDLKKTMETVEQCNIPLHYVVFEFYGFDYDIKDYKETH